MEKRKVVVFLGQHEEITEDSKDALKSSDCQLFLVRSAEELLSNELFLSSEGLLVRGAIVDDELINKMPNLKVIARAGVGTDNIDIDSATKRKVYVCNVPDANFNSVAEHVMGFLINLSHQIMHGDREIKKGNFEARHHYVGAELAGKTIGVIGFGRIGQLVAHKCINGFDMNVLAYDPYVKETDIHNVRLVEDLAEIYKEADFITLHLPYIPALHHFIDADALEAMKDTAYIINCARGGLIDEDALVKAINNKVIAGAAVDVYQFEPVGADYALWEADNLIATPHTGASTHEALARMSMGAAKAIIEGLDGGRPSTALNMKE